jgi:hypothetical protein
MNNTRVDDQVFILRFWREAIGNDEFCWRAQVRNVNTRQRQVADDIEATLELVRTQLRAGGSSGEM